MTDMSAGVAALARAADPALRAGARPIGAQGGHAAGRRLALGLLAAEGAAVSALGRRPSGAPDWPSGFCGSIAHDADYAVAVVTRSPDIIGLGIDVEPAEPLPLGLVGLVTTAAECATLPGGALAGRRAFCAKEAVFKATHPQDGAFLEAEDILLDGARAIAWTRAGYRSHLGFLLQPRLTVLAFCRQRA